VKLVLLQPTFGSTFDSIYGQKVLLLGSLERPVQVTLGSQGTPAAKH
jgi:hypothetical protein